MSELQPFCRNPRTVKLCHKRRQEAKDPEQYESNHTPKAQSNRRDSALGQKYAPDINVDIGAVDRTHPEGFVGDLQPKLVQAVKDLHAEVLKLRKRVAEL